MTTSIMRTPQGGATGATSVYLNVFKKMIDEAFL